MIRDAACVTMQPLESLSPFEKFHVVEHYGEREGIEGLHWGLHSDYIVSRESCLVISVLEHASASSSFLNSGPANFFSFF